MSNGRRSLSKDRGSDVSLHSMSNYSGDDAAPRRPGRRSSALSPPPNNNNNSGSNAEDNDGLRARGRSFEQHSGAGRGKRSGSEFSRSPSVERLNPDGSVVGGGSIRKKMEEQQARRRREIKEQRAGRRGSSLEGRRGRSVEAKEPVGTHKWLSQQLFETELVLRNNISSEEDLQ